MKPLDNSSVVDSSVATYWVDEDNIIYYNMKPVLIDSVDKAMEHFDVIRNLSHHTKACLVADVSDLKPLSKEVQKYFGDELPNIAVANAIVSKNPLGRMIANLFFLLNASDFPMKSFSNVEDAKKWIIKFNH